MGDLRHRHLAEYLETLEAEGIILAWAVRFAGRGATWTVTERITGTRSHTTREAEALAVRISDASQLYWRPVAAGCTEAEYRATRAAIAERRRKLSQSPESDGGALSETW